MSGLDDVRPLAPRFAGARDGAREARPKTEPEREERRKAFLARRGIPQPTPPRPSWAQEVERQSFNTDWADWQAEQLASRAARRAQFKAQRRMVNAQPTHEHTRTSFARAVDL